MFENSVKEFELNEVKYPYKCSLLVLERIQNEVGDLVEVEDRLRGYIPKVDVDGVIDRTEGHFTMPDVGLVCKCMAWMLEEGKDITGAEADAPTEKDLKRQDEYTLNQLAIIVYSEFEECVAGKKSKKKTTKK